jgi:hypothetical protein
LQSSNSNDPSTSSKKKAQSNVSTMSLMESRGKGCKNQEQCTLVSLTLILLKTKTGKSSRDASASIKITTLEDFTDLRNQGFLLTPSTEINHQGLPLLSSHSGAGGVAQAPVPPKTNKKNPFCLCLF